MKYSPATPFAFTELGVAMLSSVLKSDKAVEVNIAIMRAFVLLREHLTDYAILKEQVARLEKETHMKFKDIHQAMNYLLEKDKAKSNRKTESELDSKPKKRKSNSTNTRIKADSLWFLTGECLREKKSKKFIVFLRWFTSFNQKFLEISSKRRKYFVFIRKLKFILFCIGYPILILFHFFHFKDFGFYQFYV